MGAVTQHLDAAAAGDRKASAELLPLVYDELRKLAAVRLAAEPSGHTLQPTALVHEAFLRLVDPVGTPRWDNQGHFFAAAALAMRRILVDHARRRRTRDKRGGGQRRVELEEFHIASAPDLDRVIDLDAALSKLEAEDPTAAAIVNLHYFAGLSIDEVAGCVGLSRTTAYEQWAFARAWLRDALRDGGPD